MALDDFKMTLDDLRMTLDDVKMTLGDNKTTLNDKKEIGKMVKQTDHKINAKMNSKVYCKFKEHL